MEFWNYDYSTLSKMFNAVLDFVHFRWSHTLLRLDHAVNRFPHFNERIITKLQQDYPNYPIPNEAVRCALFVDGTRFRICRPSIFQRLTYNRHKKIHNQGAQAIYGPDGFIYHWYDCPLGRHHDQYYMADSRAETTLADLQQDQLIKFWMFGDCGYESTAFVKSPLRGDHLTPLQLIQKEMMSGERICAEWGFSKLKARNPFVTQIKQMKLLHVEVCKILQVAAILTNCHSCLHQSQTALYFQCWAPSLDEYLI